MDDDTERVARAGLLEFNYYLRGRCNMEPSVYTESGYVTVLQLGEDFIQSIKGRFVEADPTTYKATPACSECRRRRRKCRHHTFEEVKS